MTVDLPLAGVIFDLDGTLVDSKLDFSAMRREAGLKAGQGILEQIDAMEDPLSRNRALAVVRRHELAGAAAASWMPGARAIVCQLVAMGVPVGIVTRNSREAVTVTSGNLGISQVDVVAREDAPPKPSPEGLHQLARRWCLSPDELIYVGDFLYDLQAAANAGMRSALYLSDKNRHYAAQADIRFRHFSELQLALDRLITFQDETDKHTL